MHCYPDHHGKTALPTQQVQIFGSIRTSWNSEAGMYVLI